MADPPRISNAVKWTICAVASLGFLFDIYEVLVAPLVLQPAVMELGGFSPGTAHQITVYYAELTATGRGQREFNVLLNGSAQSTNLDIYATTGAQNWAYQTNYGGTADGNGNITITFQAGAAGLPIVNGIVAQ